MAKAELADNGPVRGTMVIRPYGYAIWERMQAEVDDRIKATGAAERLLPAVHPPEPTCEREAEHVEGFSPELAVVTTPAARSSTSRSSCGPRARRSSASTWRSGSQSYRDLPAAAEPVGATSCAGSCGPACSCAPPSSSGRRATPPTPPRTTPRAYALAILHEVYEDFMVNVLAMPVLRRAQDGEGAVRRRPSTRWPARR